MPDLTAGVVAGFLLGWLLGYLGAAVVVMWAWWFVGKGGPK